VTGQELLDEEMIKLPLNIATSGVRSWKDLLTRARDKRDALAKLAAAHADAGKPLIRPIVLVQVERTGKDQREAKLIHSEDVKEYLIQRLGVAPTAIAIKTAATDDIEGVDLLDPGCPIEWIITKSALQEGWDCPFAYILVSLNNTSSSLSMTQLVGRVLRQPYQERTPRRELNESYVYCLHQKAGEISKQVKGALEKEGYEGEAEAIVVDASRDEGKRSERTASIRESFLDLYREPFEGRIYLPLFCVKQNGHFEVLDYYRHLVSRVDTGTFAYDAIDWPLAEELRAAKDRFYRVTLGSDLTRRYETTPDLLENDEQVLAWIVASLRFEYLSFVTPQPLAMVV